MMKLVIFDLDDTLVSMDVDWSKVRAEVIALAAKEGIVVNPSDHLIIISNLIASKPGLKKKVDEIYRKNEAGTVLKKSYAVFPDMIALVRELHKKRIKLGIASGNHSRNIEEILRHLGLDKHFEVVCGRDRVLSNKPYPDQITQIIRKTKISRRFAIFIGDSIYDEQAAKAAGVSFFKVEKGGTKDTTALREAIGLTEEEE